MEEIGFNTINSYAYFNETGFNIYAFAKNDPFTFYDILGLYESPEILQMLVPGQLAWDNAITAYENGRYTEASVHLTAMLGEQVLFVLTMGESFTASKGLSVCKLTSGAVKSETKTVWDMIKATQANIKGTPIPVRPGKVV